MLKRVSIQNFKSLKDVTLDLQKVNLLIGPNNSGKTNFLKALEFCYTGKPFGSFEKLSKKKVDMQILINKVLDIHQDEKRKFESFVFKKDPKLSIKIFLSFDDTYPSYIINWNRSSRLVSQYSDELSTDLAGSEQDYLSLLLVLGQIIIFRTDPNKFSQPGPVGTGAEIVNEDASNLVGFLDLMLSKYRRTSFNQIEVDLNKCLPEFDEINLDDVILTEQTKRQLGDKSFKRIGLTSSILGVTYWADELSEGTLYFLALLCIINQPNPPKILLLEEPEKGIHPRRIREVMDFIFRLAEEKDVQIILTTHNEHVLDDFATRPESVFVFDKDEEGATYVRNLQKDIIEPTNQRNRELGLDEIDLTTNLSENWLYGLLGGVPAVS